jgi:hypothetical protein
LNQKAASLVEDILTPNEPKSQRDIMKIKKEKNLLMRIFLPFKKTNKARNKKITPPIKAESGYHISFIKNLELKETKEAGLRNYPYIDSCFS